MLYLVKVHLKICLFLNQVFVSFSVSKVESKVIILERDGRAFSSLSAAFLSMSPILLFQKINGSHSRKVKRLRSSFTIASFLI